jgi:hypothetical protein
MRSEIKFIYKKKEQLYKELYYMHIQNAKTWKYTWYNIEESINKKLQNEMKVVHEKTK